MTLTLNNSIPPWNLPWHYQRSRGRLHYFRSSRKKGKQSHFLLPCQGWELQEPIEITQTPSFSHTVLLNLTHPSSTRTWPSAILLKFQGMFPPPFEEFDIFPNSLKPLTTNFLPQIPLHTIHDINLFSPTYPHFTTYFFLHMESSEHNIISCTCQQFNTFPNIQTL